MTRLENYLNEAVVLRDPSNEEAQNLLLKDCKKFLRETRWAFYRGSDIGSSNDPNIHRMKARPMVGKEMRAPKDTPTWIHKLANKAFKDSYGWSPRQGVFASDMATSANYGRGSFLFFPIGNYNYLWSPSITDFFAKGLDRIGPAKYGGNQIGLFVSTLTVMKEGWEDQERRFSLKLKVSDVADEWKPYFTHFYLGKTRVSKSSVQKYIYDKLLEVTRLYTTTNLETAVKQDSEVSFRVKEYYLVPTSFLQALTTAGGDKIGDWARRA